MLEFPKIRKMLSDFAVTELGRDRCHVFTPRNDYRSVIRLQSETEEAVSIIIRNGCNPVLPFSDIQVYLKLASVGSTLPPKALLSIAEQLKCARSVRSALVTDHPDTPLMTETGSQLHVNRRLEEEIFENILSETEISDHASTDLFSIRRHIRLLNERVRERLNAMIRSANIQKFLMDNIVTMRNNRYVLPVKAECRQNIPGIVHDQSSTGSTVFIEPTSIVELGNDLKQWSVKEHNEIERILADYTARVATEGSLMERNQELLADIDVIFARAQLGRSMRAVTPKINKHARINLIRARHPLIDPREVVASNIQLGDAFSALIITGPNTGGKTVTLKTVGLLALMAQSGMQIPAEEGSEMPVFDEVFADIGDEQSIEQSLSTFSSHMTNIVTILSNITENSLVLFDELCAGTDPTEGAALAMSILDSLLRRRICTVATTHYSELKLYALSTAGIENASMEFDIASLRPTYRLIVGIPGKSNAFEISRKLGLPEPLIADAGNRLTRDHVHFEDVIANAELQRKTAEKERQLAEQARKETQKLLDEAEAFQKELNVRREQEMRKAREKAREILRGAMQESEEIITALKSRRSDTMKEHELHEMRSRLRNALSDHSDMISENAAANDQIPTGLKPGDTVMLLDLNSRATVLTAPDSKGECVVQAGSIKFKSNIKKIRRVSSALEKKAPQPSTRVSVALRAVETECDVRGNSLEEALLAVDMFLDGAIMNRLREVTIIHGKGTGILRSGIHKHLKTHVAVRDFRLGRYGEGEDGVTVVTLR